MAKHETHKSTAAGKSTTQERKRLHAAKRTPPMPLDQLARELNIRVVTK
jgi:hypothetical protein